MPSTLVTLHISCIRKGRKIDAFQVLSDRRHFDDVTYDGRLFQVFARPTLTLIQYRYNMISVC